jgi:hypothetical protein
MSDYSDYEEEEQYQRMIEESLRSVSEGAATSYLGTYGDAVQQRVDQSLSVARELAGAGFHAAAVVAATSAIEITIRFLLIRPLLQGAFLSDEWAEVLTKRIASGRIAGERELLPAVLRQWSVDITKLRNAGGELLWETSLPAVWRKRNLVVHEAASATSDDSNRAVQSAELLLKEVVAPLAKRLGFTIETTGKWSEIREEAGSVADGTYRSRMQSFLDNASPFGQP